MEALLRMVTRQQAHRLSWCSTGQNLRHPSAGANSQAFHPRFLDGSDQAATSTQGINLTLQVQSMLIDCLVWLGYFLLAGRLKDCTDDS